MSALDASGAGATPGALPSGAPRVGFFGKLPGRGDFVRRDLPNGFVDGWDSWLQQGLEASRNALGEAWLDAWLCAPIWRFALPAGICGTEAWAGVMMPSVDRAGRYFPLTLAVSPPPGVPAAAMLAGDWIGALEAVALSALEEGCEFEQFGEAVAALPAFPAIHTESWAEGWRARGPAGDPAALSVALAVAQAAASRAAFCVFATRGGGRVAPAAWALPSLPPIRAFVSLIDDRDSGVPGPAAAIPAGMAVPVWLSGAAPVPPLPTAGTDLGHAAGLFGSEYATDAPATLEGEPPGGAFDHLFEETQRQAPDRLPEGAFDAPAPAVPTLPEDPGVTGTGPAAGAPAPIADDEMKEQEKEPGLSPRELFGDTTDDIPATAGNLFGDNDDKTRRHE
jgi:type VI secretion system protein ImpM